MLKTIVKKELLENIFSYRFPLFALICVVLIPLGLFVNNAQYGKRLRDYGEQVRLADEASKGAQDPGHHGRPRGHRRVSAARPCSPSSPRAWRTPCPATTSSPRTAPPRESRSSGDETLLSTPGPVRFRLPRPDGHQPDRPAVRLGRDHRGEKGVRHAAGHAGQPPAPRRRR